MRFSRQALKVCHPVIGPKCRLAVRLVSGLGEIERFDGGKTRGMAVAALVGQVAAEVHAISLFGGHGRAMHNVLWPLRSRLDPLDQLASMFPPLRIFFRMK